MISWLLSRLSRRHPAAGGWLTAILLVGGTLAVAFLALRDLTHGQWVRPAIALAVLAGAAVWLSWTGVSRSLTMRRH